MKIPLLSTLAVAVTSFATWSGFAFKDNYQYNKKMGEYGDWREEFFKKGYGGELVCENKANCSGGRGYLPFPNENKDWAIAYKSFLANFRTNNYYNIENLKNIKNSEEWKDYCYGEIKKSLNDKNLSFNPSGSTPGYESCVLGENELKR